MSTENVDNHRVAMEVASSSQRTLNTSATLEQRKSTTETQQDLSPLASENTAVRTTPKTKERSWNNIVSKNTAQSDSASTNNNKSSKERNRVVTSNKLDKNGSSVTNSSGLSDSTLYSASQISHSKTLHKRFHLPDSENLLGEFACALGKGVLMQGKLYMTNSYLCFFSGLFGRPLRVVIPLNDISSIRKKNVAMIFPTAIQVVLKDGKKYFFASFLARNLAFQRLYLLWTLFKQGKLAELKSSAQFDKILETFSNQEEDNEDTRTADDSVVSNSEDSEVHVEENQETDEQQRNKIAETLRMFEKGDFTQTSMFDSSFTDQDHLLVSYHLSTSVLHLGELIALNSCPVGNETGELNSLPSEEAGLNTTHNVLEEYHELRGDSNLEISKWQRHSTLGCIRTIKYYSPVHNKALAVGISKTRNEEYQRICLNPDKDFLLVEWTNQLLDIPFGDTFVMQTRMEAHDKSTHKSNNKPGCEVNIYLNVEWKKKVMWRRMIESNIHRETVESYETLIKVLKKHIENVRGSYMMDEMVNNGNAKSIAKAKLEVQTDLTENSQKNKSSSSQSSSLEEGLQSANRKGSWNARLRSLETQLYALFVFVLLISLVVLIGFFLVLRSQRTQGHVLRVDSSS
ncbi:protein vascular associated death 1, chloroplastic [Galdieria sulphuraria]|nr:protein vascular associated death 1, chloroplastic [Galdieria sulphuraria]